MDVFQQMHKRARAAGKHIVLPEGTEKRTLAAAVIATKEKLAKLTLLGKIEEIKAAAAQEKADLTGIDLIDPASSPLFDDFAADFYQMRKKKGISMDQAAATMKDPLYFGAMMVHKDFCDGMVAGAENTTSDVLRPALQIIKTLPGISVVSGSFLIVSPNEQIGEEGRFLFADSGVNPTLTAEQMAEVAYCSAQTAMNVGGIPRPRIAMISFSTKGSAKHETVDKVIEAVNIAHERFPSLEVDGEFQVDAAIIPRVGEIKAPGSPVAGHANILIFPDLQSGNACYKVAQYFGNCIAIGPILQGTAKPVNDLSRGCSVDDIVNMIALNCCQCALLTHNG